MRKYLLIAGLACLSMQGYAFSPKSGELSNVTRLTNDAAAKFENPRFSPDGKQIAFTSFGYDGLFVMNADGTNMRQISDASGVGYDFKWSADAQSILVRDTRWEGTEGDMTRAHAAVVINTADGKAVKVTADHPDMQPPVWRYAGTKARVVSDAETAVVATRPLKAAALKDFEQTAQRVEYQIGFITDTETLKTIDANGNISVIYNGCALEPKLSPDGRRVAFNDEFDNVKVMNIDGTGLTEIAKGFRPAWLNDGQLVIERTTDDGHTYLTGDLFMVNLDSKAEKALTKTSNRIEMNPAVSADGNRIVFTDFNDGQVYIAEIK